MSKKHVGNVSQYYKYLSVLVITIVRLGYFPLISPDETNLSFVGC